MALVIEVGGTYDAVESQLAQSPLLVCAPAHQCIGESKMDL